MKFTGKGGTTYSHRYAGTFVTRDGALMVVPPLPGRSNMSKSGRDTEKRMLKVLFSTNLNPRADPSVARGCETRDGRKSEFSKLVKAARDHEKKRVRGPLLGHHCWNQMRPNTISSPSTDRRFDCLLLVGAARGGEPHRQGSTPSKVGKKRACFKVGGVSVHAIGLASGSLPNKQTTPGVEGS